MRGLCLPLGLSLVLVACGGRAAHDTPRTADGGAGGEKAGSGGAGGANAGGTAGGRVPKNHRPSGDACVTQRATSAARVSSTCPPDNLECINDSDCSQGDNGRCLNGHFGCTTVCSYDECKSDAECDGNVPCECRATSADLGANRCETTSGCRVDADCGSNGFCSPSVVDAFCSCLSSALCDSSSHCYAGTMEVDCACGDSCGHGYYCHTPNDTCIDDSDCNPGDSCNYDRIAQRWECNFCLPIP